MPQIKVRIEKGVETAGDGQEKQEAKQETKQQAVANPVAMLFYHQAISTGKQIVSAAASNVGNFTGDSLLQDRVNMYLSVVSDLTTIVAASASKGVAGFIVSTVGVTTKGIISIATEWEKQRHIQLEHDYLSKRSGNTTTNGSRGTEN